MGLNVQYIYLSSQGRRQEQLEGDRRVGLRLRPLVGTAPWLRARPVPRRRGPAESNEGENAPRLQVRCCGTGGGYGSHAVAVGVCGRGVQHRPTTTPFITSTDVNNHEHTIANNHNPYSLDYHDHLQDHCYNCQRHAAYIVLYSTTTTTTTMATTTMTTITTTTTS